MNKRLRGRLYHLKRKALSPSGNPQLNLERNAKRMRNNMTKPELLFRMILMELKIKFECQKIVGNRIYDFFLNDFNMLVEIDGDYYHSNPDFVLEGEQNKMQKRNVQNDKYKDTLATGMGFKIERVWENDLKENYISVKNRFKKIKYDK